MHGCNVVIITYRVCKLCASYSALINFAMFNFREIDIYIYTSQKYYYEINKNTFKFELI